MLCQPDSWRTSWTIQDRCWVRGIGNIVSESRWPVNIQYEVTTIGYIP